MRIAYVCTDPGIPVFGCKGASIHVQEMLRALQGRGADLTLFSPRVAETAPKDLQSVDVRAIPPLPEGDALERADAQIAMNDTVRRALQDSGPYDMVYERHALFAYAAMEYAQRAGTPSVLEVNSPLIDEQTRHRSLVLEDAAIRSAHRANAAANHIVAVSAEVANYVEELGGDIRQVEIVPNAVNPARFPIAANFDGPFRIGFLGTLKPWHDVALIVDALRLVRVDVPDAELIIVGDGPEREALESQVRANDLAAAVTFCGAVAADEVPAWLARMHVGLATYQADQPFYFSPLKLFEYMAAGLPTVVSRIGALPSIVEHGVTGLCVEADDVDALASALIRLAAHPGMARVMGTTARERTLATRTWDRVAARILARANVCLNNKLQTA